MTRDNLDLLETIPIFSEIPRILVERNLLGFGNLMYGMVAIIFLFSNSRKKALFEFFQESIYLLIKVKKKNERPLDFVSASISASLL